ncbi:TPA: hypothetical protein ACF2DD_002168 [Clostridium perfringens]|uniref:hypothetical protein n=1 Tax=Clostridium perfringens TaxID=1502 RepID=UPI00338F9901|nr:hypothetical protein [Clostridium perfringens]
MDYKYDWNNKLKVIQINNKDKANHLKEYIGKVGEIINRISITKEDRRYKLRFDDDNTFYFKEGELEKI